MIKPRNTHFTPWHFVFATGCAVKVLCFVCTSHTCDWLTTREPITVSTVPICDQSTSQDCRLATNQRLRNADLRHGLRPGPSNKRGQTSLSSLFISASDMKVCTRSYSNYFYLMIRFEGLNGKVCKMMTLHFGTPFNIFGLTILLQ